MSSTTPEQKQTAAHTAAAMERPSRIFRRIWFFPWVRYLYWSEMLPRIQSLATGIHASQGRLSSLRLAMV